MDRVNYDKLMQDMIKQEKEPGHVPALLLHSCCAPCSSAVIERLTPDFDLTVFYYNPNIYPPQEYAHRVAEQQRFIEEFPAVNKLSFVAGDYEPEEFYRAVKGLEDVPEGGERCRRCFELRLGKTAETAEKLGIPLFTTTLTISPLKNAQVLNTVGQQTAEAHPGLTFLPSDFKKRDGYRRSCELSAEYGMYRQDYCGCVFSKKEREAEKEKTAGHT